jgi:hypothetical protein
VASLEKCVEVLYNIALLGADEKIFPKERA